MDIETTSEYFESVGLTIHQPKKGYRYGEDSLLLADFCRATPSDNVVELCSGCGVISLIIAKRDKPKSITMVEIQEPLYQISQLNVELNNLGRQIQCVNDDYRSFALQNKGNYDVVVANPPFFALGKGRRGKDALRTNARHELHGSLSELVKSAACLLKTGGTFFLVFTNDRADEVWLITGRNNKFVQKRVERKRAVSLYEFHDTVKSSHVKGDLWIG